MPKDVCRHTCSVLNVLSCTRWAGAQVLPVFLRQQGVADASSQAGNQTSVSGMEYALLLMAVYSMAITGLSAALLYLSGYGLIGQGWKSKHISSLASTEPGRLDRQPASSHTGSTRTSTTLDRMLFSTMSSWDLCWNPGCVKVLSVGVGGQAEEAADHLDCSTYDVRQVGSAEDMMSLLHTLSELPDVILMRVALPGMDGFQACQAVRHTWSGAQLPIIVITPANREEDVVRALEAGANDSISWPLRHQELKARIHTQLALNRGVALAEEANKNLELLRSILPRDIIARLKTSSMVADFHPEVTFLFSDIKNFTVMASTWPTQKLIGMLNCMFSAFDDICEKLGVYKVETIGDAYFIVSGVHDDGTGDHAYRMMTVAAAMLQAVEKMAWGWEADEPIQIRIGVHTGPAHSGVVGKTRPRYCFFGDAVNVASRMETTGFPGTVHVSDATRKAVQDWQEIQQLAGQVFQWSFTSLGPRLIKGKGLMVTHLANVGNIKPALAELQNQSPVSAAYAPQSPLFAVRGISSLASGNLCSSGSDKTAFQTVRGPSETATDNHWGVLEFSHPTRGGRTDSGLTDTDLIPLLPGLKSCLVESAVKQAKSPLSLSPLRSWTPPPLGRSNWCPARSQSGIHPAVTSLRHGHSAEPVMAATLSNDAQHVFEEQFCGSIPAWPAPDSGSSQAISISESRNLKSVLSREYHSSSAAQGVVVSSGSVLDIKLNSLRDAHMQEVLTKSPPAGAPVTSTARSRRPAAGVPRSKTVGFSAQGHGDAKHLGGLQAHVYGRGDSVDLSRAPASTTRRTVKRRHSLYIPRTDASPHRAEMELLSLYDSLVNDLM